ncbi:MAG: SpoIIIAH-like family protein [Syntrophomonas sp.]
MNLITIKGNNGLPKLRKKQITLIFAVLLLFFISIKFFAVIQNDKPSASTNNNSRPGEQLNLKTNNKILEENTMGSDFFSGYRMERERVRGKQIDILNEVINEQDGDKQAKAQAAAQLIKLTEDMEKEMKTENLVKSKGYKECVVITQTGNISVVLKSPSFSAEDEKEIKNIVSKAMDCKEEKLCIIIKGR